MMACTCREYQTSHPYGDGTATETIYELCAECDEARAMAELDERFAEFNAEEVSA